MFYPTPQQMKKAEAMTNDEGISYLQLMENAGKIASDVVLETLKKIRSGMKSVLIFAGSGNNGGDGFVIARHLYDNGIKVTVVIADKEPQTEISAYEYCKLGGYSDIEVTMLNDNIDMVFERFASADVIVDAVFGTGFHGELPPAIKACFSYASRCTAKVIAIDVPSGGNCLTGEVAEDTLKADITVTFASQKLGMIMYPLKDYCGKIVVGDIGIPEQCFEVIENVAEDYSFKRLAEIVLPRKKDSHKGCFGKLLNISGSNDMSGASALSTLSALRSGAGIVKLATTKTVVDRVASSIYECTFCTLKENKQGAISITNKSTIELLLKDASCVSVGCGITCCDDTKAITETVIENAECPVVLDADAINCVAKDIDMLSKAKNQLILTPHPGEMARLLNITTKEVMADRYSCALKISSLYKVTVVAKGVPTLIAGDGKVYLCNTGNAGLARGGSGDVLTGIISAFVAQGIPPLQSALAGVLIHGRSAERVAERTSMLGMLPTDIINELPLVFREWNTKDCIY